MDRTKEDSELIGGDGSVMCFVSEAPTCMFGRQMNSILPSRTRWLQEQEDDMVGSATYRQDRPNSYWMEGMVLVMDGVGDGGVEEEGEEKTM
jgi:hypothetical protein